MLAKILGGPTSLPAVEVLEDRAAVVLDPRKHGAAGANACHDADPHTARGTGDLRSCCEECGEPTRSFTRDGLMMRRSAHSTQAKRERTTPAAPVAITRPIASLGSRAPDLGPRLLLKGLGLMRWGPCADAALPWQSRRPETWHLQHHALGRAPDHDRSG